MMTGEGMGQGTNGFDHSVERRMKTSPPDVAELTHYEAFFADASYEVTITGPILQLFFPRPSRHGQSLPTCP
jgi:hypothetical protein